MTETDATLLVADHHQRREAEAATALHNLGDAVDVDQPVYNIAIAIVAFPFSHIDDLEILI